MAALVLLLLAALGGRAVLPGGRCAAPLADLRSQISGVETLLEEFRRQLQQEEPGPPATAGGGGGGGERCGGSGGFSARPDSIIRTKDSIAAGATFLRAPGAVSGWRQCLDACCAEPRCTLAVVQGPARPRGTAAEPGCYLFNCTHRGRPVCRFAPHRGYSSYSRRTAGIAPPPTGKRLARREGRHGDGGARRGGGRAAEPPPEGSGRVRAAGPAPGTRCRVVGCRGWEDGARRSGLCRAIRWGSLG